MTVIGIKFRLVAHKDTALKAAPRILHKNLVSGLEALGKRLQSSARSRMRKDTGAMQRNLKYRVSGRQADLTLEVFSTLVQAFVDAYGLRRGVFPDFGINSKLYKWARRRVGGIPTKETKLLGVPKGPRTRTVIKRRIKNIRRIKQVKKTTRTIGAGTVVNSAQRFSAKNAEIRRVAFLVARAIYRQGISASEWPSKTLEANRSRIVRELQNALSRAANEISRA